MIPVGGDNVRLTRYPAVTRLLALANVVVFFLQFARTETDMEGTYLRFGVVPARVIAEWSAVWRDPSLAVEGFKDFFVVAVLPFFTSMFLHGGPLHLLGNMVFLWIFGDNVEDRMGPLRFLVFYLLCGISATTLHVLLEPEMKLPVVGASGAIAGVLGAFMVLYPRARVLVLVPIFFFVTFIEVGALFFLAVWFLLQLPVVHHVLGFQGLETVAYWAHVGGFLAGLVLVYPFVLGRRRSLGETYRLRRR